MTGRRADPLGNIVLLAVVAFLVVVLAAWFRLDTQPPRWDESHLLMLSEYSYEQLARGNLLGALHIERLTNVKTGMLPFLSAISYFVVGNDERLAAFLDNAAFFVLLAFAMRSLSLQLFGDALPAAAGIALIMSSTTFTLYSHSYNPDIALVALVAFTVAAAVEIRAREFAPSMWNWALGLALVIGIPMKHLYSPFVAMPLLFTAIHYAVGGAGTRAERRQRLLRVGTIALAATLVGLGYHLLNWRAVAELLLRAGDPARTGGFGAPYGSLTLLQSLELDLFRTPVIGRLVLLVAAGVLFLRARFALTLLMVWIVGVAVAVAIAASFPFGYYFLPFYPAFALLATGWLGRPLVPQILRRFSAAVCLAVVGLGAATASFVHLGTYNPIAVALKAPSILLSKGPIRNPFVDYDSMAPAPAEALAPTHPYAHDWRLDEFVAAIGKAVARGPADRTYSVALMSDMEYMSQNLIEFKLRQHKLHNRVTLVSKLGQSDFENVDFLIFKTGDMFSVVRQARNPVFKTYEAQIERFLANEGAAVKRQGFSLVLEVPLPDGSTGTVWVNRRSSAK
jgi:hypothetical protein